MLKIKDSLIRFDIGDAIGFPIACLAKRYITALY